MTAIFVALVIGLASSCSPGETDAAVTSDEDDSTPVAGYEVELRELSRSVRVSGTVEPVETVHVKSYFDGILTTLTVEEGDAVRKGEVLAATETAEYRAERRRAEANVDKLERQLERKRPLVEREAIRPAEVEDIEAELTMARRNVEVWQTRIDLAELRSPLDAVVTRRFVDPGTSVAANDEVVELADVSTLVVPVRMSDREVVHIEQGESVDVTVDAYEDRVVPATVRRIFPSADPDSRRVIVELELGDLPQDMVVLPGFRARATIDIDERPDVLAVPSQSLLASTGDDEIVYIIDDAQLVERTVTTGVERGNWTEIVEGISKKDVIVGTNPTNLREGMTVHVSQWVESESTRR